jgi:hypothetical protein
VHKITAKAPTRVSAYPNSAFESAWVLAEIDFSAQRLQQRRGRYDEIIERRGGARRNSDREIFKIMSLDNGARLFKTIPNEADIDWVSSRQSRSVQPGGKQPLGRFIPSWFVSTSLL